jgi:hypothetical protein
MPTQGSNFVLLSTGGAFLSGSTIISPPCVLVLGPNQAMESCNAAPPTGSGVSTNFANNSGTSIDRVICDLALTSISPNSANLLNFGTLIGGYGKNGALCITFTGTTAVTIDVTALATAVGVTSFQGGDSVFANINCIVLKNTSATSVITIAPGGSNPLLFPVFGGTTPTLAVGPGGTHVLSDPVGAAVSSSHRTLLLTPSAGGSLLLAFGGA